MSSRTHIQNVVIQAPPQSYQQSIAQQVAQPLTKQQTQFSEPPFRPHIANQSDKLHQCDTEHNWSTNRKRKYPIHKHQQSSYAEKKEVGKYKRSLEQPRQTKD